MRKTFTLAVMTTIAASVAFASDAPYDRNEALSPAMIEKIKQVYADDFGKPALVRVAGDTEAFSAEDVAKIHLAFAAGS